MEIKVDKSELDAFSVKLGAKASKFPKEIQEAIKKSSQSVERQAKSNLTSNGSVKTGHLRRSITHTASQYEGKIYTNVKYAKGVEEGTRPHVIRPKKKKALYWAGASHPVKTVNHPGSKGKPYMKPALEAEKPKFINNLKKAIKLD